MKEITNDNNLYTFQHSGFNSDNHNLIREI